MTINTQEQLDIYSVNVELARLQRVQLAHRLRLRPISIRSCIEQVDVALDEVLTDLGR